MLIHTYQPRWETDFNDLKETLQQGLKGIAVTIEHVGSTSVKNLAAKPIIDMDMVYEKPVSFPAIRNGLEKLGYYHNGDQGIKGREAFKRATLKTPHNLLDTVEHHLYVCRVDNQELRRHLLFRDYLRTHEEERKAYESLKYTIAEKAHQDRKVYATLKEHIAREFVASLLKKAGYQAKS